jgi:predicted hydrocarbon binding protein
MSTVQRSTLGPMMDVVCFQYLRICAEEYAGRAPIVSAGRKRGMDIVEEVGLTNSGEDAAQLQKELDDILGLNGTRLCLVQSVKARPEGGYEVKITESACTAGQTSSEPLCAYTLGVFTGAIQALTGRRMQGRELECSACGHPGCTYVIEPV